MQIPGSTISANPPGDPGGSVPAADISSGAVLVSMPGAGLQIRVSVQAEDRTATDPFAELPSNRHDARLLPAALTDKDGTVIMELVLKLQHWTPSATDHNADADEAWRTRLQAVETFARIGPPRGWVVGDVSDRQGPARLAPRLFCRHVSAFFRPRSPVTIGPLEDCRDEAWLAANGLPPYGSTYQRFLYSPEDAGSGRRQFYSASPSELPDQVSDLDTCIRDLGKILGFKESIAQKRPKLNTELQETFPCYECPEAHRCFPPDGQGYFRALDRLVPLNVHDAYALAVPRFDLRLSTFRDLVAGRAEATTGAPAADLSSTEATAIGQTLSHAHLRLYQDANHPRHVVETALLSWSALTRLASLVLRSYATTKLPILNLSPEHVMVRRIADASPLPALWGMETGLVGVGAAEHLALPAGTPPAVVPPGNAPLAYASPRVSHFLTNRGEETVKWLGTSPSEDGGALLGTARLRAGLALRPGDLLAIRLVTESADQQFAWARMWSSDVEKVATFDVLAGQPADAVGHLAAEQELAGRWYPQFSLEDDLYSLGAIALDCLWTNHTRSLSAAIGEADELIRGGLLPADDASRRERLQSLAMSPAWHPRQMFGDPGSAAPIDKAGFPTAIWAEMLGLVIQLLALGNGPGVSRQATSAGTQQVADDALSLVDDFVRMERALIALTLPDSSGQSWPSTIDASSGDAA